MSESKMRDEFEAWAITSAWMGLSGECLEFIEGGYVNCEVQAAWLAWQASRESLVIEAPHVSDAFNKDHPYVAAYMEGLKDFREAIEAAGVKVKA